MTKKIALNEWKANEAIEITTDDGSFVIPHPLTWSDALLALAESGDNLALCTALLGGAEAYARFVKVGGSQAVIGGLMEEHFGDMGKSSASPRS